MESPKSGFQTAAEENQFQRWWDTGNIGVDLKVIWEISDEIWIINQGGTERLKRTFLVICIFLLSIAVIPGSAQTAEKTLYERLGGENAIKAVVDQFVANNNADKVIADRWKTEAERAAKEAAKEAAEAALAVKEAAKAVAEAAALSAAAEKEAVAAAAVDIAHLKEYLTELICQATGGPCVYTGKHMDVVHAGLNITEEEFNRVVVNLSNALDKFNVPQKEKGELLAIVGSLKSKIVGL